VDLNQAIQFGLLLKAAETVLPANTPLRQVKRFPPRMTPITSATKLSVRFWVAISRRP
jgi:hypothetical protein